MQVDWELSQTLVSDGHGVRGVAVVTADDRHDDGNNKNDNNKDMSLFTGTQGGTVMEFGVPSATVAPWSFQHDNAVTAVCYCGGVGNEHILATGSKDAKIRLFNSNQRVLLSTLEGHEKPVTSLACWGDYLVSGSWDGSANVWNWKQRALIATLPNHENSTCVTIVKLENDILYVVTGSAGAATPTNQIKGHTVRLWKVSTTTSQVEKVYAVADDHEGPIRDVCVLENTALLATCSNDGTVKLRSLETGFPMSTLFFVQGQQHPPILLSLCYTLDGCLIASSEDGQVLVWDMAAAAAAAGGPIHDAAFTAEPQVIVHPSTVWRVKALPNGDFATACEDGMVRIFTRATERMAPQAERMAFANHASAEQAKKLGGPTREEVAKLPLWERNYEKKGTSEGQVQLFQKEGMAIAAQWSAVSQTWIEVGQVMGSASTTGGGGHQNEGYIDGVRYDHVLPVQLEGNDGQVRNLNIGYNTGENPFVAAQRFIDSYGLPQYHHSQVADYIQQRTGANAGAPMLGVTHTPAVATTGLPMASYQHLPAKHYLAFELANKAASTTMEKMKTKLLQFNKLSEQDLSRVSTLMEIIAATNRYHASQVPDVVILLDMLNKLEPSQSFPALDLARLTVLHPDAAEKPKTVWTEILLKALSLMQIPVSDLGDGPAVSAIPMLSLRLFANALKGGNNAQKAVLGLSESVLSTGIKPHISSSNKNVRLSLSTLLYNLACCAHLNKNNDSVAALLPLQAMVGAISGILANHKLYEEPALMRTLQALGTLCLTYPEAKQSANALFLASKVEPAASPHSAATKMAAKEVYNVLQ